MIYIILYIISGIATAIYIAGNMCASDLDIFKVLYTTKEDWVNQKATETIIICVLGLLIGPLHLIAYRIGYSPVTWKWTNPWSNK